MAAAAAIQNKAEGAKASERARRERKKCRSAEETGGKKIGQPRKRTMRVRVVAAAAAAVAAAELGRRRKRGEKRKSERARHRAHA